MMKPALLNALIDDDPVLQERWLISYADLLTLMLAFFVVMYSIAQLNDAEQVAFSRSISELFSSKAQATDSGVNESNEATAASIIDMGGQSGQTRAGENVSEQRTRNSLETRGDTVQQRFSAIDGLQIRGNEQWLQVELDSNLLFAQGGTALSTDALILLHQVAQVLASSGLPMKVEGYTDDLPVAGGQFASNWELSAARAAAVVRYLATNGVAPEKMVAAGYGEFQPVASNQTAAGRARNRRVTLLIARNGRLRPEFTPVEPELFEQVVNDAGIFVEGASRTPEQRAQQAANVVEQEMEARLPLTTQSIEPDPIVRGGAERQALQPPKALEFNTLRTEAGGLLFTNQAEPAQTQSPEGTGN